MGYACSDTLEFDTFVKGFLLTGAQVFIGRPLIRLNYSHAPLLNPQVARI
mgnify:CR=1 FL=1